MKNKMISVALMTLLAGCGAADGKKATDTNTNGSSTADASLLLSDNEAAGQTASAQIDSGISAAVEENEASTSGLSLITSDKSVSMERFRDCTVSGSDAVVDIRHSITRDYTFTVGKRTGENKFSVYMDKTRTWSRSGGSVACASDGKHADIAVADIAGTSLDVQLKEQRARSATVTNSKTGKSTTKAYSFELDGTRHVDWKTVTKTDSLYEITKNATENMTRTVEVQKKDGTKSSITATVKNADGAPFVILVERDVSSLEVQTRTVQSGTLEAVHADGTRVETVFKNVKYTSGNGCMPTSGEIDGSIFKKDATTASSTFTISFSDDTPQITFADGTAVDYSPEGCELDDPTDKATDESSKTSVTAPSDAAPAAAPAGQ